VSFASLVYSRTRLTAGARERNLDPSSARIAGFTIALLPAHIVLAQRDFRPRDAGQAGEVTGRLEGEAAPGSAFPSVRETPARALIWPPDRRDATFFGWVTWAVCCATRTTPALSDGRHSGGGSRAGCAAGRTELGDAYEFSADWGGLRPSGLVPIAVAPSRYPRFETLEASSRRSPSCAHGVTDEELRV